MPVGIPTYFTGDIYLHDKDPFGFFEVEIIAPGNMNKPFLQTRVKNSKGVWITLSPLGTWKGWYFSEELKERQI